MRAFMEIDGTSKSSAVSLEAAEVAIETLLPRTETRVAIDEVTYIMTRVAIWNALASPASSAEIMVGNAIMRTLKDVGVQLDGSIYGD